MAPLRSPVGENTHAGQTYKKLQDIHQKVVDEEERLRILKLLQKGNLCTRDIMIELLKGGLLKNWAKA